MSELVPTPAIAALQRQGASVAEVLSAVHADSAPPPLRSTPIPQDPTLTPESEQAITQVVRRLAELVLPDEVRKLTPEEMEKTVCALSALVQAQSGLTAAKAQLKTAFFNHCDAVAQAKGQITGETPLTKEGWAVLPDTDSGRVEGLDVKATREVRGGTPCLDEDDLMWSQDAGIINHEDYLAMTRPTRVVDEDAVLRWMRQNPDRIEFLARGMSRTATTVSLHVRPNR